MRFDDAEPRCIVMIFRFSPTLGACLQQGGDGGVDTSQRSERSVMYTPSPPGTVTARPADLSGRLHPR